MIRRGSHERTARAPGGRERTTGGQAPAKVSTVDSRLRAVSPDRRSLQRGTVGGPGLPNLLPGGCRLRLHICIRMIMLWCMRTSVVLNDELLRRIKRRAADQGVPMKAIIETALRAYLAGPPHRSEGYRFTWKTFRGRLRPGVDLDNRDSLYEIMEGRK